MQPAATPLSKPVPGRPASTAGKRDVVLRDIASAVWILPADMG